MEAVTIGCFDIILRKQFSRVNSMDDCSDGWVHDDACLHGEING